MNSQHLVLNGELIIQNRDTETISWKGKPNGHLVVNVIEIPEEDDCIVLLEYWTNGNRFNNLLRINSNGSIIWMSELPSDTGVDAYVKANWQSGNLVAWSWSGFMVTIDHRTGKILTKEFKK